MTVTYTAQVASCKRFGCFWKLLFRTFEKLCLHCQTYGDLIPVSFVLGFYISIVVKRWWDQYLSIPWPDPLAILVSAFLCGQEERSRLMRRTIMRYANLSLVITLRMMCPTVKKRFPTVDHLVDAGFMLPKEKKIFARLEEKTNHPKYWLPLVWSIHILNTARREDLIKDDFGLNTLIHAINSFRSGCGSLLNYDWISIPLVYSQVVTLAVYTYFLATLMGNQYLNPKKGYKNHTIDLVVPIFTLLQFFFYMGWLLVAETLVNPFGEDDDDFEVNWLIDRNLQISYLIVDEVHEDYPELGKDQYWEEVVPTELPYTEAAKQYYMEPFLGSTRDVDVPMDQRGFVLMSMFNETDLTLRSFSGERKETTPLQISIITPNQCMDSNTSSHGDGSVLSSSNSILKMLKKKYGQESTGSVYHNSKHKSSSRLESSPIQSINSTTKKNFNDYTEDIFWMSDFSIIEPRSKQLQSPQVEPEPSVIFETSTANDSYNATTPVNQQFENTGFITKSNHVQERLSQGEQLLQGVRTYANTIEESTSNNQSSTDQAEIMLHPLVLQNESNIESSAGPSQIPDILLAEVFNTDYLKEVTLPKLEKDKEIVDLHNQILLEEPFFKFNEEAKTQSVVEIVQETSSKEISIEVEFMPTGLNIERADELNQVETQNVTDPLGFEKPVPSPAIVIPGSIVLNDHLSLPVIETTQNTADPLGFEKPVPSPAIVIPGSIVQNDHLSLPVIETQSIPSHIYGTTAVTLTEEDSLNEKLE